VRLAGIFFWREERSRDLTRRWTEDNTALMLTGNARHLL
jgi:hypothetical protein